MPQARLYLISPPRIDLTAFAGSLEGALSVNRSPLGGEQTTASVSEAGVVGGKSAMNTPHASDFASSSSAAPPQGGSGKLIGAFQLRLKDADDDDIRQAVRALMPICHAHECAFILNDRPDLCAELSCDGVHLGQEDLQHFPSPTGRGKREAQGEGMHHPLKSPHPNPLPKGEGVIAHIRSIIGEEGVIGVSCHASKHLAMEAGEQGADYVAFGAFYPTTSKPMEKLAKWGTPTPEILEWWSETTTLPCVAIGGITPTNCAPLVKAGADFLAVITSVWNHPDGPRAAVAQFASICQSISSSPPEGEDGLT